jgi:hypothetical protein
MSDPEGSFLAAVGLDADSWSDTKQLVGRAGKFNAEADGDKVYYRYLPARKRYEPRRSNHPSDI